MQKLRVSGSDEDYDHLKLALSESSPIGLKDLLEFKKINSPVPVEEVEPIEDIRKRFTTSGNVAWCALAGDNTKRLPLR